MKKILLAAAAVLVGTISLDAQNVVDSVEVDCCKVQANVKVVEDEGLTVRGGHFLDFDIPFYGKIKKRSRTFDRNWVERPNLGFAFLKADGASPYDFSVQNSYELFAVLEMDSYRLSRMSTLSWGVGVDWKNFAMSGRSAMVKDDSGKILIMPYPERSDPKMSKLRLVSVILPFYYSCAFGRGWGFTLGPVLNYNAYSSIVNKYTIDGEKQKDRYKKVHCNTFTVDLVYQLNIRDITLFVKYCPMPLMDKTYWPDWRYGSAGIALSL